MVRLFADGCLFCHIKAVVICVSVCLGRQKSVADLKSFDCTDGKNCFGEIGVQFFKYGIADSGGNAVDPAFDHAAGGIVAFHAVLKVGLRFLGSGCVRHIERIFGDLVRIKGRDFHGSDGFGICKK